MVAFSKTVPWSSLRLAQVGAGTTQLSVQDRARTRGPGHAQPQRSGGRADLKLKGRERAALPFVSDEVRNRLQRLSAEAILVAARKILALLSPFIEKFPDQCMVCPAPPLARSSRAV
jgi:hypothetical protein